MQRNITFSFLLSVFIITNIFSQWEPSNGPYGGIVNSIVSIGPNVYAGTVGMGVYTKKKDSNKWESNLFNLANANVLALAVSGSELFAGTEDGLYAITDDGNSWRSCGLNPHIVTALTTSGAIVFAGTDGNGVYQSTDDGKTWMDISFNIGDLYIRSLLINGTSIYAGTKEGGIYLTSFGGTSWVQYNNGLIRQKNVKSLMQGSSVIYAGTEGGVYNLPAGGNIWKLYGSTIQEVTSLAKNEKYIFAASPNSVFYRQLNGQGDWVRFSNDISNQNVSSLLVNDQSVFAGTLNGGVFLSPVTGDNSSKWSGYSEGMCNESIPVMFVDRNRIFAGSSSGDGLFYSDNNGDQWIHKINDFTKSNVSSVIKAGTRLIAGTSKGVYLSDNNGESWAPISNNIGNVTIQSLKTKGEILFAATIGGVYKTSLSIVNWSAAGLTGTNVTSLVINDAYLVAGTVGKGLFVSTNDGADWVPKNGDDLNGSTIYTMVNKEEKIFAAVEGKGVFYSSDYGNKWFIDTAGFKGRTIKWLAINEDFIYAGTNGVLRKTVKGSDWKDLSIGFTDKTFCSFAFKDDIIFGGTIGASVWKKKQD